MCFAHGTTGRFLVHTWVNAEPVPRFYPNVVTLTAGQADIAEQRQAVRILLKSHLPGRWAVKDSFGTLDIARLGFEVLQEASWIRKQQPKPAPLVSGLAWERAGPGGEAFPTMLYGDENFAMFSGRRDGAIVAGGTLYRADKVVGLSNVVADADDEPGVWRDLCSLAAATFPGLPLVGYESGDELTAAHKAGFEIGDPLRIWVKARD
ncbi:hypothetical protein [Enhydrobacter sp.]|uniref:hypothetical protein n=1 Tax=Enhydrobacter sp. TaxID=1894999 RepID=UPI00262EBBD0|nr:hypothetical protein [Enhydrobacter sp.]WIM14071.1 MAG: hypothetical protein OJF58_005040 [Enhydrobacter sp.]